MQKPFCGQICQADVTRPIRRAILAGLRAGHNRDGVSMSDNSYPKTPSNTHYDPTLGIYSEYVVKFVRTANNPKFRVQMGSFSRWAQIVVTGSSDQVESEFELAIQFWPSVFFNLEQYRLQVFN